MAEPELPGGPNEALTPGGIRREGLKRSKWIAAGVAVGAAAFLTGVIAGVNGADDGSADGQPISSAVPGGIQPAPQLDDERYEGDDAYEGARPFDPQSDSGSSTQPAPSAGPQTRSGGS